MQAIIVKSKSKALVQQQLEKAGSEKEARPSIRTISCLSGFPKIPQVNIQCSSKAFKNQKASNTLFLKQKIQSQIQQMSLSANFGLKDILNDQQSIIRTQGSQRSHLVYINCFQVADKSEQLSQLLTKTQQIQKEIQPSLSGNSLSNNDNPSPPHNNLSSEQASEKATKQSFVSGSQSASEETASIHSLVDDTNLKYFQDLKRSLKNCIVKKKLNVSFSDIAGNEYAKAQIQQSLQLPLLYPNLFNSKGIPSPWKKILLYGPPGVGKTMLSQAICSEYFSLYTIFQVSLSDLTSKFVGESEKLLRMLMDLSREHSPSILILDEMDSIGRKRNDDENETERRIKTEFLKQLDDVQNDNEKRIYVVAITNMPWELDIAVLRRFEKRVLVPMPIQKFREELLLLFLGEKTLTPNQRQEIAEMTQGYSGADMSTVVSDAFMRPLKDLRGAHYFKVIQKLPEGLTDSLEELKVSGVEQRYYMPISEGEESRDAQQFKEQLRQGSIVQVNSLNDIPSQSIILREVTFKDFKQSVKNCKPTVPANWQQLYKKFLLKYGHIEQKEDLESFDTYPSEQLYNLYSQIRLCAAAA